MNTALIILSLRTLASNFYLADFFDVLIIALFIYVGLVLFKQARSFPILIGIGIVVGLYAIAQVFNLYLTTFFLQSFFGVFLVVLVVLFQEELRRFFELIAHIGTRQRQASEPLSAAAPIIEELIQAISNLAHRKIGALMVLVGNENIERHIEGGVVLDGSVSQELLESIFDPTSPGHDGALIINKNRAAILGAHLPLSHNFAEIGKYGTRHSAALGIAERSDAMCVVISEERGTISITKNGKLIAVTDIKELEEILYEFLQAKFPAQASSFLATMVRKNTIEKLFAVVIAGLFWFFLVFTAGTVRRDFTVPISYRNLSDALVIEETRPKTITVTLASRGKSFTELDPSSLEVIVDASSFIPGEQLIKMTENSVKHPITFSVINIAPQEIRLHVSKISPQVPINTPKK